MILMKPTSHSTCHPEPAAAASGGGVGGAAERGEGPPNYRPEGRGPLHPPHRPTRLRQPQDDRKHGTRDFCTSREIVLFAREGAPNKIAPRSARGIGKILNLRPRRRSPHEAAKIELWRPPPRPRKLAAPPIPLAEPGARLFDAPSRVDAPASALFLSAGEAHALSFTRNGRLDSRTVRSHQ